MTEPPKDPPIVPQDFLGGVKVVDIGDLRVARGFSRRPASVCKHPSLRYDDHERRIWCPDCEQNVDAFDAFKQLVEQWSAASQQHNRREQAVAEAEAHKLVSLAAKEVDRIWRGRHNMVPNCPVCGEGLFPEDFKRGIPSRSGRDFASKRREKIGKPVPGYKPMIAEAPET